MTVHVFINGGVQGVGFRRFMKHHANKHNAQGWIKNLPDGRVEAVFAGDEKSVKKMVEISKRGPFLAEVKDVEIDWNHEVKGDIIDFQIIK